MAPGEVPEEGEKANVAPIFRKSKERIPGKDRLVSPSTPLDQILLAITSRKEEKVTGSCQHRFTNGRSCAACVLNFSCDEVTGTVEAVGVVSFDSSKALVTVFHNFLLTKLVRQVNVKVGGKLGGTDGLRERR